MFYQDKPLVSPIEIGLSTPFYRCIPTSILRVLKPIHTYQSLNLKNEKSAQTNEKSSKKKKLKKVVSDFISIIVLENSL